MSKLEFKWRGIKPTLFLFVTTFLDLPYYVRLALSYSLLFACIYFVFPTNHDASQVEFNQKLTAQYYKERVKENVLALEKKVEAKNKAFGQLSKNTVPKEEASFDNLLKLELEKQINRQLHYQNSSIFRDMLSSESMPYNESASASVFDKTRQIDNALLQTALKLKMPLQNIKVQTSYVRSKENTFFLFQKIYIDLPEKLSQVQWSENLKEQLSLWANNAKLENNKKNTSASISVDKVKTHEIFYNYDDLDSKLSIVIDDLGAHLEQVTHFTSLNYPITFSILPDMRHAKEVATLGHFAGMEVLLHQPMEDLEKKFIERSSLLINDSKEEIKRKFLRNLEKVPYAIGLNNHTGSGFTAHFTSVEKFLSVLIEEKPYLHVLDSVTSGKTLLNERALKHNLKSARRNVFIDNIQKEEEILKQLDLALAMALSEPQRHVVVIGHPYKETIRALKKWQGYKHEDINIVDVF